MPHCSARRCVFGIQQIMYYKIIVDLANAGAGCLILGCTEIGLPVDEVVNGLPFETTKIHAIAA
ncbi:hypothetical protein K504DRAFT_460289 [Pleomassaria siparia CBS 279.74]|uniref:Aspartate racemase n=1 Tax=Pleomassaria siparia CBS 279.74 TaxID=1314801 RepID=A0A6G1JZH6_9PLEO|nr:hypothetical protein K504DRAFT_460289 [Pleomassaria siparia CBS 279.74]